MTETVRGQRPLAPEPLRLVQEFANTVWLRTGEDAWVTPEDLYRWLVDRRLLTPDAAVTTPDLRRAVRLRDTLRETIGRGAGAVAPEPFRDLLLCAVPDRAGGLRLEPAGSGVNAALARVVVAALERDPRADWARLKMCAAPDCRWVFYDPSRNRSATWCNMSVCGARAKSHAYYRRHRAAVTGAEAAAPAKSRARRRGSSD